MSRLVVLLLAGVAGGCTADTLALDDLQPAPARRKLGLLADAGGAYQVLAFDPALETFAPIGPPLPAEGDQPVLAAIDAGAGRAYVQLETGGAPGRARVLINDGGSWRTLVGASSDAEVYVSEDMSLLFISEGDEGGLDAPVETRLMTFDGQVLFQSGPEPRRNRPQVVRLHPGGRWALLFDGDEHVLVTRDGEVRSLGPPRGQLFLAFDERLVFRDGETIQWFDLFGALRPPPDGFVADPSAVSAFGFQVADGRLSRVLEHRIEPIQPVPSRVGAASVLAAVPGRVVYRDSGALQAIGPEGETLSTYRPLPPVSLPDGNAIAVQILSDPSRVRLTGKIDAVLVFVSLFATQGDVVTKAEFGFELWAFDGVRVSERFRLATFWEQERPRVAYLLGDSAYAVKEGALSRLHIDSLSFSDHAYEAPLLDVPLVQVSSEP